MEYSLSYRLGGFAPRLDPDAAAYIAAVETALSSSITADQKNAINDFIKTGKSDGWYSSIKRLYLPIWADAAANAIDMVTRTSGTFSIGGVDHSNVGYVQGDGIAGYFDAGVDPSSLGQTPSTGMIGALLRGPTANAVSCGVLVTTTERTAFANYTSANAWVYQHCNNTIGDGSLNSTATRTGGIIVCSREGGNRSIFRRQNSGFDTVAQLTNPDYGSIPTAYNIFYMGANSAGTASNLSSIQYGAFYAGLGMDVTSSTNFTLALKDLWETASGLTLP